MTQQSQIQGHEYWSNDFSVIKKEYTGVNCKQNQKYDNTDNKKGEKTSHLTYGNVQVAQGAALKYGIMRSILEYYLHLQ